VVVFVFTVILAVIQEATGIGAENVILPQWGPGLAALLMLALFRKDQLRLTFAVRRPQLGKYIVALLLPLLVAPILLLILGRIVSEADFHTLDGMPSILMLAGMFFGAFGEELGWRGCLQQIVDLRYGSILSALPVGVLWALWHMQLYQNGLVYMLFLIVLMVAYSIIIYWLIERTGYNVLVATLFHLGINVGNLLFLEVINETSFMIANALIWVVVAFLILAKRQLLLSNRRTGTEESPGVEAALP
jgi:membrane protease YdiL (CAAX protease family)